MKKKLNLIGLCCLLSLGTIGLLNSCDNKPDDPVIVDKNIVIEGVTKLNVGESATLVAKAGGQVLEGVTWSSSNKSAIIVDSALGEVTALNAGTATITAIKAGYTTAQITITAKDVSLPNLVIVNNSESSTIKQGETLSLSLRDSDGNDVSDAKWTSEDSSVAIVSATGLVSGRGVGETTIIASKTGYNSASIKITVVEGGQIIQDTYSISYKQQTGVTFDGPTSAKAGETVTFTVTPTADGVEVTEVKVNGSVKNKINGKYSFVMPEESVLVEASIRITNSDVSIGGDIILPLALNSEGVYQSEPTTINYDSNLTFYVNVDGQAKALSYRDPNNDKYCFDFKQCFAHLETSSTQQFMVDGGYSYVFYYDPISTHCYVKRDQVLTLPSTPEQFETLFDAGANTISTYPENVSKVVYRNASTDENYERNKYQNNVSIASIDTLSLGTNGKIKHVADVYKAIKGDQLTVVDTYVETTNYQVANHGIRNDQQSTKYSGVYNIYDSKNDFPMNSSNYSYTRSEAEFMANLYSHDVFSLELDFYQAYRASFTIEDTLKFADLNVSSVASIDGGFTTTVDSYKTYVDSQQSSNNVHYEYDLVVSFDSKGRMLEGTYEVTAYDEQDYDFTNDKFLPGGINNGTTYRDIYWSYEYKTVLETAPSFETSQYFIDDIKSLRVNNNSVNSDVNQNVLKKGDIISIKETDKVDMEYTPETALDSWQYGVVASSNEDVIGPRNNALGEYQALGFGTSTLTFGNHTTNTVLEDVTVTVASGIEPSYWFFDCSGVNGDRVATAHTAFIYQGEDLNLAFRTSPSGSDNRIDGRIELSDNRFFTVEYNDAKEILSIKAKSDAFNYTIPDTGIEITINIYSSTYKGGNTPCSVNKITIFPSRPFSEEKLLGTYKNAEKSYTITFSDEKVTKNSTQWNKGEIVAGRERLVFGWTVTGTGYLDYTTISYTGTYEGDSPFHYFEIGYDANVSVEDEICVAWSVEYWGGLNDISMAQIVGQYWPADEYDDEIFNPIDFVKVK